MNDQNTYECNTEINSKNNEVVELQNSISINVWGTNQQTLEGQALEQLNILTNNIKDDPTKKIIQKSSTLDINLFIKRQQELAEKQLFYKQAKQQKIIDETTTTTTTTTIKRKRKKSEDDSESDNNVTSDCDYSINEDKLKIVIKKNDLEIEKVKDDGDKKLYKQRLTDYFKEIEKESEEENNHYELKNGLKVPIKYWNKLYAYQREGVEWLWELHQKQTGGILGDEMGLGKTIQMITFLNALEYSAIQSTFGLGLASSLIICPVTIIHQWVAHFHKWAPEFRVAVLHQSGTYRGLKTKLIKEINTNKGILIMSYSGILKYKAILTNYHWNYLILDEGHKIRNPSSKITKSMKEFHTPHRIMLTGSPMQNNLQELWSLFDFTNRGILGNQQIFTEHFINPIISGGFSNATPMQQATALSVAKALKNLITPYLLRRSKSEVQNFICLPDKTEQVLFCSLTEEQLSIYKNYLMSDHIGFVLNKESKNWFTNNLIKSNVLIAIQNLRKICNHPDLYLTENDENTEQLEEFGYYKRSGKMIVVSALLKIWKKQNHRVLLFTQGRIMIKLFEKFLNEQNYTYIKMDGTTPINSRQSLINKFNDDETINVFLLTTRVGGLGVNLTGADRVIIFDPDWNPAIDTQARERAWRIGQNKQVTIYRLLSAGTIEEKMYQRQIWKQLLSNKILIDPKTQRLFKTTNLYDLFSIPDNYNNVNPETTNIFHESRVKFEEKILNKNFSINGEKIDFSKDKIDEMKNFAQQIAKSLTKVESKKSMYQIELDEERKKKKEFKDKLKKLTPTELLYFNREKNKIDNHDEINKVDDCETVKSFDDALNYTEKTAKLYNQLKYKKKSSIKMKKKKKFMDEEKNKIYKSIIDNSGKIDGEDVEGLLKTEIKKLKKKFINKTNKCQDQYILEKLFYKKGVSGALHHDLIVDNQGKLQTLKIRNEAKIKADQALEALRKSRLNNWRW